MALWCSHCDAVSETLFTAEFVSCSRCGKVIEEVPIAFELSELKKRKDCATMWCSHCIALCKARKINNFLDCPVCGKVLGDSYSVPKNSGPIRNVRKNKSKVIRKKASDIQISNKMINV